MVNTLPTYSDMVTAVAVADRQNLTHAAVFPNYALFNTPLKVIYLPRSMR